MEKARFDDYRSLLAKATAKFDEIKARHGAKMACGRGCSQCCAPALTVFPVEREHIRSFLRENPSIVENLVDLERRDPHQGRRCSLLGDQGECSIYEVRPLICRTHGAPVFFKEEQQRFSDVCPKNFTDPVGLDDLSETDFINLDLLNGLLALVNRRFEGRGGGVRSGLRASELVGE